MRIKRYKKFRNVPEKPIFAISKRERFVKEEMPYFSSTSSLTGGGIGLEIRIASEETRIIYILSSFCSTSRLFIPIL